MSVTALLRFAPAYDTRHFVDDPSSAPELVVSSAALEKVKREVPTPIVVDHDLDCVVGQVRDLYIADDVDYGTRVRKWWFASCEITEAPGWLKRGGGVSWSWSSLHTREIGQTTVVVRCLLKEISLLTPSTSPAQPLARVCLVQESPAAVRSLTSDRAAAGEVFDGDGTTIARHGIGRVLGVR